MNYLFLFIFIFSFIMGHGWAIAVQGDKSIRSVQYERISKHLEALNDDELLVLLKQGTPLQSGWGSTIKLQIDGISVFVKQIPLNKIEGNSENMKSTENLFDLPVYYQYGVGSGGFSVWREVAAHEKTTEWVLLGENQNFPLMYHWRILDNFQEKKSFEEDEFNKYVAYWENSSAIGERVKANHQATANVVLFIEYIPETLKSWLNKEFKKGNAAIDKAIGMVEENLQKTALFLSQKQMIHFDAHFLNILTDGTRLYFSDFGLAISSRFSLSSEELQFFQTHSHFDRYYVATKLTNWIVAHTFGKEDREKVLQMFAEGKSPDSIPDSLTPFLASIIRRYAPLALKMNHFFELLTKQTKETPYPAKELQQIWYGITAEGH